MRRLPSIAIVILCVLTTLSAARHWGEEPRMLIDGATMSMAKADDMCDVPFRQRSPLKQKPLNPLIDPWEVPNGATA